MPDAGRKPVGGTTGIIFCLVLALAVGSCASAPASSSTHASGDEPRVAILRTFVDAHHLAFTEELRALGWHPRDELDLIPAATTDIAEDTAHARARLLEWQAEGPLDLVVAFSTPFAAMAAEELPDVPTLVVATDPVASGLIEDRDAPEGSLTGLTFLTPADRTLDLAIRTLGPIERLGYLVPDGDLAVRGHRAGVAEAASEAGVDLVEEHYDGPETVAGAVERLAAADVDAVWLANSNAVLHSLDELEEHLDAHRLPTISNTEHPSFAAVILTPDGRELRRQLARQAARLLAGTPVAAIPVEDPRRFDVIIDQTQIEAFGLPTPDLDLLNQADLVR